jgi:hypothetical protein
MLHQRGKAYSQDLRDRVFAASVYPPEAKSLAEATDRSGCAGVKMHRQEALCLECKGLGDEAGGAVCEGPLRGTD